MAASRPEKCEYLAVVSEWSNYAKSGTLVGNAYPVFNLTEQAVVEDPLEEFPNPGAVFLTNRGELKSGDFVRLHPTLNQYYSSADEIRNCYYIAAKMPQRLTGRPDLPGAAVLLDVPRFDPLADRGVIRNPAQYVTPLFFVRTAQGRIFGPLQRVQVNRTPRDTLESIQWGPGNDKDIVYEFTLDSLQRKGLRLLRYAHPQPELNEIIAEPIQLVVGPIAAATGERAVDLVPDGQLADWFLKLRGLPEPSAELLKALRGAAEQLAPTESDVIRQRFERLAAIFSRLELFQTEHAALARRFLNSPEGRDVLLREVAQEVERRLPLIEEEVRKRRSEVAAEEQRLLRDVAALRERHEQDVRELNRELQALQQERAAVEDANQALQKSLEDGLEQLRGRLRQDFPLVAVLAGLRGGTTEAEQGTLDGRQPAAAPAAPPVRPARPSRELEDLRDEPLLVDRLVAALAAEQLRFTREFVANIFIALKAFSLNLVMGPPGYGKSSLVSALARGLGHGEALLEIPVRRSWSDDRHLLGFYDAFHGRYDPGLTGLVGRLLQAEMDWQGAGEGLYFILLDEFNLAAPEYYFGQLLQVTTREVGPRVLHLYDAQAAAAVGGRYPPQAVVHPNVSFWGTINYDETTERLSPRVLDRTGMIFLSASDVLLSAADAAPPPAALTRGVRARDLVQNFRRTEQACPDERWELIRPLLELLRKPNDAWGPGTELSPRVFKGIQRYLANSVGLLEPAVAVDYAFQQRVLPVLRGRGAAFGERVKALQERLVAGGFTRSARHVADTLHRAEQNFGDVDFLAYD